MAQADTPDQSHGATAKRGADREEWHARTDAGGSVVASGQARTCEHHPDYPADACPLCEGAVTRRG